MNIKIELGNISVEVMLKDIKNIHLSVNPPFGKVRISAPLKTDLDVIRIYALTKLSWIKKNQKKIREQERSIPREFLERESHYVWGKRYLLSFVEAKSHPFVVLKGNKILLHVRPSTTEFKKYSLLEKWYRQQIRNEAQKIIEKWSPILSVSVSSLFVQHMKTKWGGCCPKKGNLRLNSELSKKPLECLEYVVLHEMTHLLEPTHNKNFFLHMDRYLPNWQNVRDELNNLPVPYGQWG